MLPIEQVSPLGEEAYDCDRGHESRLGRFDSPVDRIRGKPILACLAKKISLGPITFSSLFTDFAVRLDSNFQLLINRLASGGHLPELNQDNAQVAERRREQARLSTQPSIDGDRLLQHRARFAVSAHHQ